MEKYYQLLKDVLSVPTKTYKEEKMIEFLTNWLETNGYDYYVQDNGNIYVTKTTDEVDENFHYPCVVAHTDTVHEIDTINIHEVELPNHQGIIKPALMSFNDKGIQTGIGGDDKAGIFACLVLLQEIPNIKVAFFVSEETGCHGSLASDDNFFKDVGYAIQFDAPGNWMVTEYCFGIQLFNRESEFFGVCSRVLNETFEGREIYQRHPYTDVMALKQKYDFSCINFAIGYYNYHTSKEYVIIDEVYTGIKTGKMIIEGLGNKKHYHVQENKLF
jgi:tripeptide aminopeptidase